MTIIYTILIFGIIIFIHELGHFLAARWSGVTIYEFALGMGPAIYKHKGKKTTYSLRLLPIGGYVSMAGEDEECEDENALNRKPIWKRMIIVIAGAFMNLVLGLAIMLSLYATQPIYNSTTVAQFLPNATTQATGLKVGDKIVKINKTTIFSDKDIINEVFRDSDGVVAVKVLREGKKVALPAVKFDKTGEGTKKNINIDFKVKGIKRTVFSAVDQSFKNTLSLARNSWLSVADLVTGKLDIQDLSGPVGVGQVVGQASSQGFKSLLFITAFITISIGMFNLLPFPALDGGRFIFLTIEAIRRKPINPKIEGYVNGAGLVLLLGLMVVVTLKDILGLF
ncbi:M50 family metallopeptidase [Paludicola sp. MB14-C6]|uniref:M50 family metallopeptidase n=1 Tax=Paludihabitans sp. MB14-C6 TaxID=3070656 RepID=UPI0027DAF6EB|nr:M50 family metallopeptidase [Paludicola sp. MB14-C6]WMJ23640.1 M50 family metallopeptidase [Paludicola sp. MB14-C6]